MSKSDIKIEINGELVKKDFDRMHLCELGENINKNGVYQIGNDFTFYVNEQKFTKITAKVDVEAHAFSAKAEAAITEKGGNAVKL